MKKVIEIQLDYLRDFFSDMQGTCNKKFDGTKIKSQADFAKKYFPNYEINKDGFVLMPKRLFFKKKKFGPVSRDAYTMNLCHAAHIIWEGRIQEIRQFEFQETEVLAGRMAGWKS